MMQANGRFIEYVQHTAYLGTNLRGEADALSFAAGERGRRTIERNVAQTYCIQKLQALNNLVHDAASNELLASSEFDFSSSLERA